MKLREARRQEQANNPHYLKDDSPRSYQQDDIPVAEIALEVPLQVHSEYFIFLTSHNTLRSGVQTIGNRQFEQKNSIWIKNNAQKHITLQ